MSDVVKGGGPVEDTGSGTPDTGSGPTGSTIEDVQTSAASTTCGAPGNVNAGPVALDGVTVVSGKGYGGSGIDAYVVMDPPNGPNAGVLLVFKSSLGVSLKPGDVVDVVGTHKEYYCLTEVFADSVSVVSSGNVSLTPISVTTAQLAGGVENLEGSLVTVTNVTATAANDQYGDFPIGNGVLVDDTFYKHVATASESYTSVTGFVTYAFSAWRIMPRSADDIVITP
jgi:predicted extracellular nuclease